MAKAPKAKAEKPAKAGKLSKSTALPAADPAAPGEPMEVPAPAASRGPSHAGGRQPIGKADLRDNKVYATFTRVLQVDAMHVGGEFFANNAGPWSMRVDGVTHVRDRTADPVPDPKPDPAA